MELGISSIGHFLELALSKKFKNLVDLLLEASEACLTYAEDNDIKVCELFYVKIEGFLSLHSHYIKKNDYS